MSAQGLYEKTFAHDSVHAARRNRGSKRSLLPEPSENNPETFFGIALGSGVSYERFVFDIAYQYRFGRDVQTASFTVGDDQPVQDVDQHQIYVSVIHHF